MTKTVLLTVAGASLFLAVSTVQAQQGPYPLIRGDNFARPAECPAGSFYFVAEDMIASCAGALTETDLDDQAAENTTDGTTVADANELPETIGEVDRPDGGGAAGGGDVDIDPDTGPGPETLN